MRTTAGRRGADKVRNGRSEDAGAMVSSLAGAGGGASAYDDPMAKVLGLDDKTSGALAWFGFTSGSTLLLVALMALTSVVAWVHARQVLRAASASQEIDIAVEPPPPPPPPEPEAKPEPAAPPPRSIREIAPPPPPPAQAAKVITQEPDPNEPVDLTGNTIVQGSADTYAGGFTTAKGTNTGATRTMPAATGVPGGGGPAAAPVSGPDRSRALSLGGGGGGEWSCPFPPEADSEQIDDANVTLRIEVRPDGTAGAVTVVADPGHGFAREARRCGLARRFAPALDRGGNPIAATGTVNVHFSR